MIAHIKRAFAKPRPAWVMRIALPIIGLASLLWFIVRVIPKPSRAMYPCQRAAFPMASYFVIWLLGLSVSSFWLSQTKWIRGLRASRRIVPLLTVISVLGFSFYFQMCSGGHANDAPTEDAGIDAGSDTGTNSTADDGGDLAPVDASTDTFLVDLPVGNAKGIFPGRVVWAHDPDATSWDGDSTGQDYWWKSNNTDQEVVDAMLTESLLYLTGQDAESRPIGPDEMDPDAGDPDAGDPDAGYWDGGADDGDTGLGDTDTGPGDTDTGSDEDHAAIAAAWDQVFRYFNREHGRGDVGYTPGEKIIIKVNFVGFIAVWGMNFGNYDYPNTSPQIIHAVLDQLVNIAGVKEADITVGDPLSNFDRAFYNILAGDFPDVSYLSYNGGKGMTKPQLSTTPFYWSTPAAAGTAQDYVPVSYTEATYLINIANLKGHFDVAGVTLCAKNHYGTFLRAPLSDKGHYNLHLDQPIPNADNNIPGSRKNGQYRTLVDLMGHDHVGGKTLLYLIDGLYGGRHQSGNVPVKWKSTPFNGDWTSSLFTSLDPVAIDSVGLDFLVTEWPEDPGPASPGTDDYLIEAAMANDPISGTFYDPNHATPTERLKSLGAHEHWNNATEKRYSRNLGAAEGIELVQVEDDFDGL